MENTVVTPEAERHNNMGGKVLKQSELWEEYAYKLNAFTDLIINKGIDPELLTDVVRATIILYRDKT
jgi:hypothetical protein